MTRGNLFVLQTRPELGPLLRESEAHGFVLCRPMDRNGATSDTLLPIRARLRGYWFACLAEAWRHADAEAKWRAARKRAKNARARERQKARAAALKTDRFVMARKAAAKAKAAKRKSKSRKTTKRKAPTAR